MHFFSFRTLEPGGIQGQTGHKSECQWQPVSKRKQKKKNLDLQKKKKI